MSLAFVGIVMYIIAALVLIIWFHDVRGGGH